LIAPLYVSFASRNKQQGVFMSSFKEKAAVATFFGVFIGAAFALNAGYADKEGAEKALGQAGYTDITVGDANHNPFACRGFYRTKFEATGANGKNITGTVCDSWGAKPQIVVAPQPKPKHLTRG